MSRSQAPAWERCVNTFLDTNLSSLVADDIKRRNETEKLYIKTLSTYRQLAKTNPALYLPNVPNTLFNFGSAYSSWKEQQKAFPYLQESAPYLSRLPNNRLLYLAINIQIF